MRLRNKILLYFGTFTLFYIVGLTLISSLIVKKNLVESARRDVRAQLESVHSAAKSLIDTAISNYLRGVVDMNITYLDELNEKVERGDLTLEEAKQHFQDYADRQRIGESGYIVAIREKGEQVLLEIHPFLRGMDANDSSASSMRLGGERGYSVYDWRNPDDESFRKKSAYMEYYETWDWTLGATVYEDELYQLINVEDLRGVISSFMISGKGYFFLMDSRFIMRIHPTLEGQYVHDLQDSNGNYIIQEMLRNIGDFYEYNWTNPETGEDEAKYALVDILEPFGWYVVASGYVGDTMRPIKALLKTGYLMAILVGGGLIFLVLLFSRSVTRPLSSLMEGIREFHENRILYLMQYSSVSEIESVGSAVEKMTRSILDYEKEKSRLSDQLNRIINAMPSMLIGVARDGEIIFLNDAAIQYAGAVKEKVLGKPVQSILDGFDELLPALSEGQEAGRMVSVNIVRDGVPPSQGKTYFEATVYPLDRTAVTSVIRIDDVSERTRMEEMLLHSRKMEAIGQLAGGVAHDFNNMLTAILHSLEYLESIIGKNSEAEQYLQYIEQASLRAADLTQKLLTFSRKSHKFYTPQNVESILRQTVEILKHSINKNIRIEEDYSIANPVVTGDMAQLQSMIMNMGINASQAMPDGGILTFRSFNRNIPENRTLPDGELMKAGFYVRIEVSDTGTGIPEDVQRKVFEPFYTTRGVGQGTGLGLSSVLGVVKQHGGFVSLESEPGKGTAFFIDLPVSPEPAQ